MAISIMSVYRGRTQAFVVDTGSRPVLDVASPETFASWCAAPEWDSRTLEEFALAGGARVAPAGIQPAEPWPR